jgi:hypothetical protein
LTSASVTSSRPPVPPGWWSFVRKFYASKDYYC